MKEYKIEVKPWMLKKSSPDFDFMQHWNNDIPMPLMVMFTGGKVDEMGKMLKLNLHGDIKQRINTRCMCCGKPINNKISQYFGIGPICGDHNYVNPFNSEEELDEAIRLYRERLVNTTWCGWIAKSAIVSIDDISDPEEIQNFIDNMPIEIMTDDIEVNEDTDIEVPAEEITVPHIRARIAPALRCTGDYSAFLSFSYDKNIVDAIKSIRSSARAYDPEDKVWEIDYSELANLRSSLLDYNFVVEGEDRLPKAASIPEDFKFKTQPMTHQIEGILYGLDHSRFLLADQQGVGKTKQLIDLAVIRKQEDNFKHCLVICGVNSLKWNWIEEIEKHSDEKGYILGQRTMKRSGRIRVEGTKEKLEDLDKLATGADLDSYYFIVTNIESLRNTKIAAKLKELCDNNTISMVALDESHRIKDLRTQQGQGMLEIQPSYRVAMTGTPLMNNPLDLYSILKWLGYQQYGFRSFRDHFCYTDEWGNVVGYKNIDQLRDQLGAIMLRRTKEEVLDLPEKIYVNEYVELTDEQKELYNQVIDDAIRSEDSDNECILATKLRLRQVSGGIGPFNFIKKNPKIDRLEQIVEEAIYSGTKVIVYSNWIEGIKPAIERLQKYNPVVITGETDDKDRQALVNKFQNDPEAKVFCATVGAAGTGLTLTAATEVVFLDEPWTDAAKEQACDRAHRIGTKSAVTIHTLMSHGTYDEEVHDIVIGKKQLSDTIVEKNDLKKLKVA